MENPLIRGPVTVIEPAIPTGTLCDFCGLWLTKQHTLFGARPFTRLFEEARTTLALSGSWAACVECAPLVRARRWSKVIDRFMVTHKALNPGQSAEFYSIVRSEVAGSYLQLERRFTGEETSAGGAS
jgi:hypothetical protein